MLPKALVDQGYAVQVSFGLSTLLFLVTIPGKILNGYMMEQFGRKPTIFFALFVSIFGLLLMVAAHSVSGTLLGFTGSTVVFVAGVVIAGMTVISSFPSVRIYMTEQFPTNLRGRGYFLSEMLGRVVAGIIIPYFIAGHTGSPAIFFGTMLVFALTGAFVPLLLGRETVGQLEVVTAHLGTEARSMGAAQVSYLLLAAFPIVPPPDALSPARRCEPRASSRTRIVTPGLRSCPGWPLLAGHDRVTGGVPSGRTDPARKRPQE